MKALSIAAVVAFVGTPVIAGEWRLTGESTEYVQAVDTTTVQTAGRVKTLWSVTAYYKREPEGHDYTMFHEKIDCAARTIQILGWVDRKLHDTDYSKSEQRPELVSAIIPESVAWAKYEAICDATWPNAAVTWETARAFATEVRALEDSSNEPAVPVPE